MQIEQNAETHEQSTPSQALLTGLSAVGGVGITLIVLALALGAAGAIEPEGNGVGIGVLLGLLLLVFAIGGWVMSVQPYRHFDDINVPIDTGHHAHHDDHSTDTTDAAHH